MYFVRIIQSTGQIDGFGTVELDQFEGQARDGMIVLECGETTVAPVRIGNVRTHGVPLDWLKSAVIAQIELSGAAQSAVTAASDVSGVLAAIG